MPTTLSKFSEMTGILVKPERSARESPCLKFFPDSIQTISVLGTINSLTIVSPRSKTEWIISLSDSSTNPLSLAWSTKSRNSASVENGPDLKPLPGVIAFPTVINKLVSGLSNFESKSAVMIAGFDQESAFCLPRVLGPTPTIT